MNDDLRPLSRLRTARVLALLALILIPLSGPTARAQGVDRAALAGAIQAMLADSALEPAFVGIGIVSLEDGETLFEQNTRKLFHPASNMKLLTSAAALHRLPSEFRFTTAVTSSALPAGGTLDGDLVVRGAGDPLLSPEELDSLAGRLADGGLRVVTGDLVADISLFDTVAWGSGWMWDDDPDVDFPYLCPLVVHRNMVTISVEPGAREGAPARFSVEPPAPGIRVINEAITSSDTLVPKLAVTRVDGANIFRIAGRIEPASGAKELHPSIIRPAAWFLSCFRERLAAHGVRVVGADRVVSAGPVPGSDTLGSVSRGLDTVLAVINKLSDNLAAELLLRVVAAQGGERPATALGGLAAVRTYLAQAGVDTAAMILADGSGVSWYTALSPRSLLQLLRHEHASAATFERFRASLAVAGVDGSLATRMRGTPAEGNARAKTGTLRGVSTLAGYVSSADGKPLAFAILTNHFPGQLSALRTLQNAVITLLSGARIGTR